MTKEPGKLVLVEWRDSCSPGGRKWLPNEQARGYQADTCWSVGWILRRDKRDLVLAASYSTDETGDVTAMPASAVVKVTPIKRAR